MSWSPFDLISDLILKVGDVLTAIIAWLENFCCYVFEPIVTWVIGLLPDLSSSTAWSQASWMFYVANFYFALDWFFVFFTGFITFAFGVGVMRLAVRIVRG